MKYLYVTLIIVIYSGLVYLQNVTAGKVQTPVRQKSSNLLFTDGMLRSEYNKVNCICNYDIDVELFPDQKKISARQTIVWVNKTDSTATQIQLHLYPNAYKNKHTLFMQEEDLPEKSKSEMNIKFIKIGDKIVNLTYIHSENEDNEYDSTVAQITLPKAAKKGDTVKIYTEYEVPIPKAMGRMGYTMNRNFYFISQWFPKVGVFQNGKWICSPFYNFTEFFSDFGDYSVRIKTPINYTVASTGYLYNRKNEIGGKQVYWYKQHGIHDFAFMATDKIKTAYRIYKRKDGSEVKIIGYIQPENKGFTDRYLTAVYNALEYFEKNIGMYPYETISLVDVPKTSSSGSMEYPTLITVETKYFSPEESNAPESVTIHEFAHQYFYGLLANNEVYEAWLDEGFANYFETKITEKYYGQEKSFFTLFRYYPVRGMQFMSYNEIPLVYTLTSMSIPGESKLLTNYYKNIALGSIMDTSYKHFNWESYEAFTYDKPALALFSLERQIGEREMMTLLRDYYTKYKYKHPAAEDFFSCIRQNEKTDMNWFIDNYIKSSAFFDYEVSSVKKLENKNQYEVIVIRRGEAVSRNKLVLYTDKDTISCNWDGREKWKRFVFSTPNEVKGAEIDPERKNLLDINYANNSYMVHRQFSGALKISMRWFFWMQNLLMLIGGLA